MVSLFAYDDGICTTKPGLVIKKQEMPKTVLDLSNLQSLSLFLNLTIFECTLIFG